MTVEHQSHTLRDLNDRQLLAIDAIVSGATDQAAADAAGVTRETVNRWSNNHPEFQAELNRRRKQLQDQRADVVRRTDLFVLDHLRQRVEEGDPEAIALWIKQRGLNKIDTTVAGPLTSDDFIEDRVDRRRWLMEAEDGMLYRSASTGKIGYGRPSRFDIKVQIERELRAATDCEPVPDDDEPDLGDIDFSHVVDDEDLMAADDPVDDDTPSASTE
jgi:hypothetical protein